MTSPIPQPPGVPLLGNVFDVDPKNTWGSLKKLSDKYGSIFKINALGHQIVFVGNAALAEELCDESRFRKCVTGPVVEIRAAVHDSLFTAYHNEPSWGIAHRIMAPLVTVEAAEVVFNQTRDSLSAIVTKWTASPNQRVDVTADLKRQNLQSVTACFFNQKANHLEGPVPPMISAMDSATLEAMKRPARPKLLTKLLYQKKFDKDIKTMRSFGAEIIATRKSEETTETSKADMLQALLHSQDPETGESLDQDKVIDEIINIYIGAATCPCFLSFALYYLTKSPEVITKAREEIDSVLGADGEFKHSDLQRLPYCEAILREAMRLSAVAPGFNIEPIPSDTKADIELADGKYKIPHNQAMIVILAAVNRDPEVFTEPEVFRPERMLGEAYENLPAGVKKGFGNGKRQCFGKQSAWQWSFVTLVSILRSVDLAPADKSYELKQNGAFCVEPLQFFALAGPRKTGGSD